MTGRGVAVWKLLVALVVAGGLVAVGVRVFEAGRHWLWDVPQAMYGPLASPAPLQLLRMCGYAGARRVEPARAECVSVLREAVRLMGTQEAVLAQEEFLRSMGGHTGRRVDREALARCKAKLERLSDAELVGQFAQWVVAERARELRSMVRAHLFVWLQAGLACGRGDIVGVRERRGGVAVA